MCGLDTEDERLQLGGLHAAPDWKIFPLKGKKPPETGRRESSDTALLPFPMDRDRAAISPGWRQRGN